jgi:hypothetical protein
VLAQIEVWRNELVNLARSNRLLHFRDTRVSTLGIVADDTEVAEIAAGLLGGASWTFYEPDEDEDAEDGPVRPPVELLPRVVLTVVNGDDNRYGSDRRRFLGAGPR